MVEDTKTTNSKFETVNKVFYCHCEHFLKFSCFFYTCFYTFNFLHSIYCKFSWRIEIGRRLFDSCDLRPFNYSRNSILNLRATMGNDRMNNLALLSIEREILEALNFDDLIDDFAKSKARKVNFN